MDDERQPVIVDFPLRGEWAAPHTPGHQVPSHGLDMLGQTYAYDLMQIDWARPKGYKFFRKSMLGYLLVGVRLTQCFGWRAPIYAPFDADIIEAEDGVGERDPVHFVRDIAVVLKHAFFFRKKIESNRDLKPVLGNYIILRHGDIYSMMAHIHSGSFKVSAGDRVRAGQQLAEVGHAGNSTAPHLHFQLMDRQELMTAKGLPCAFRSYEILENGKWQKVHNGIPDRRDRIRVI
ncbi:MAG: peptidase M23 [Thiotrichales bacterium SG8_50]|nr:MAG: peptidase M23 [Thiotrichales bacterium SG8_50]